MMEILVTRSSMPPIDEYINEIKIVSEEIREKILQPIMVRRTRKDILENYNISNIDVLKVGHHGSKTSSSKKFIDETNPKYGVISVGKNNKYGHPNKEILNTLSNSKIYRTDEDGSIMFKIKNNKLKIKTCSP